MVEEEVGMMICVKDGAPELLVGKDAGGLGNQTGLVGDYVVTGGATAGSIMVRLPNRVVGLGLGAPTAPVGSGESACCTEG